MDIVENNVRPVELEEFLSNAIKQIDGAFIANDYKRNSDIEIEISIERVQSLDGKLGIYVAGTSASTASKNISLIKVKVPFTTQTRYREETEVFKRLNEESSQKWDRRY